MVEGRNPNCVFESVLINDVRRISGKFFLRVSIVNLENVLSHGFPILMLRMVVSYFSKVPKINLRMLMRFSQENCES